MDTTTLKKANELDKKIKDFNEALNCFEYTDPEDENRKFSNNPRLIIEYDGFDCREAQPLPMNLSNELISFLKAEIIKGRDAAVAEFSTL